MSTDPDEPFKLVISDHRETPWWNLEMQDSDLADAMVDAMLERDEHSGTSLGQLYVVLHGWTEDDVQSAIDEYRSSAP